jgi:hypothetical protein
LLKYLDTEDKDDLVKSIENAQQQQVQQQEQMAKLQMENQQIVNESLQSKAMSDRSLAEERMAKGRLESVQIETAYNKSKHELASATLNEVKAAKEVESMSVDDFVKVFSLIKDIQANENKELTKKEV